MAEVTGDAALLVPPGDTDALAGALETALDGGAETERRRALGFEIASRYTWAASAQSHTQVYRSVI
jgi:glycosyltransferase involved in cell wall biosynthesis